MHSTWQAQNRRVGPVSDDEGPAILDHRSPTYKQALAEGAGTTSINHRKDICSNLSTIEHECPVSDIQLRVLGSVGHHQSSSRYFHNSSRAACASDDCLSTGEGGKTSVQCELA